jgi:hypothetical protein
MQCFHPLGYQIACDRCGKTFEYGNRSVFKTAYAAVETAKECGWLSLKSRPYDLCPDKLTVSANPIPSGLG